MGGRRLAAVVLGLFGLGLPSLVPAAGIYKWVDAKGVAHYDDKTVTQPRLTLADFNHRIVESRPQLKTPDSYAVEVRRQCAVTQTRLDNYRQATELYGQDPAGNVYRLSSRQVALEIAEEARDAGVFCAKGASDQLYAQRVAALRTKP